MIVLSHASDATLAKKIFKGDRRAFEEIYQRYHKELFSVARQYVKEDALAEDAVQDVFVKLWENRLILDSDRSIKGLLFKMLKNHVLNIIRYRKKRIIQAYESELRLTNQNPIEAELAYAEYKEIAAQGIADLPEGKRKIFEMRAFDGLSNAEIAGELSLSQHTVKCQYYLASKFVRHYLKKHAGI